MSSDSKVEKPSIFPKFLSKNMDVSNEQVLFISPLCVFFFFSVMTFTIRFDCLHFFHNFKNFLFDVKFKFSLFQQQWRFKKKSFVTFVFKFIVMFYLNIFKQLIYNLLKKNKSIWEKKQTELKTFFWVTNYLR